jgi:hypothetical protein
MLSATAGWTVAMILLGGVWLWLYVRQGPTQALGAVVLLSLVIPVWARISVLGIPFNVQTSITALAALAFAAHPRAKILTPLTVLDCCVALLWGVQVASDLLTEGWKLQTPVLAYGEWALPYVAGRYCIRSRRDIELIAPWACGVLAVLAVTAIVESTSGVNLFEELFGIRPDDDLSPRRSQRLGFKRAFGPTLHGIFLGMILVTLFPWVLSLWQQSADWKGRLKAAVLSVVAVLGILAAVSRTPLVCLLLTFGIIAAWKSLIARWIASGLLIIVLGTFMWSPEKFTDSVSRLTGGGDRLSIIEADGQAAEYSSSRSRLLVFKVYGRAMRNAGLLGFGTKRATAIPPEIPYLEGKADLRSRMHVIDNGYVLMTLRSGWLGLLSFSLLFLTATLTAFLLHREQPDQILPLAAGGALLTIAVPGFLLVRNHYDYVFPALWLMGVIGGLASARSMSHRSRSGVLM